MIRKQILDNSKYVMGEELKSEIDPIDLLLETMHRPSILILAEVIETIKMIEVIEHNQCFDDCSHPEETVEDTEDDKGGPIDWASCGFQDVHTQNLEGRIRYIAHSPLMRPFYKT